MLGKGRFECFPAKSMPLTGRKFQLFVLYAGRKEVVMYARTLRQKLAGLEQLLTRGFVVLLRNMTSPLVEIKVLQNLTFQLHNCSTNSGRTTVIALYRTSWATALSSPHHKQTPPPETQETRRSTFSNQSHTSEL